MDSALSVIEIIIGLILLWAGVSRIELETLPKAVISIADTAMLIIGVWKPGTLGFALALGVSTVATMAWSLRMAMEKQAILTSAAINSREQVTRAEMEAVDRRLRRLDAFKAVLALEPSRVTLHRLLGQVGEQRQRQGERLRRRVFDGGNQAPANRGERAVHRGRRQVDHLQRTRAAVIWSRIWVWPMKAGKPKLP